MGVLNPIRNGKRDHEPQPQADRQRSEADLVRAIRADLDRYFGTRTPKGKRKLRAGSYSGKQIKALLKPNTSGRNLMTDAECDAILAKLGVPAEGQAKS